MSERLLQSEERQREREVDLKVLRKKKKRTNKQTPEGEDLIFWSVRDESLLKPKCFLNLNSKLGDIIYLFYFTQINI